jgi:predicted metalloprotease
MFECQADCEAGTFPAMKWRRRSGGLTRVEDRRGGFGGIPGGMAGAGVGGLGIVGVILVLLFTVFSGGGGSFDVPGIPQFPGAQVQPGGETSLPVGQDELRDFTVFVADDVQATWQDVFARADTAYEPAGLVLFSGGTVSGCGAASSATGPFYCPSDQKVYIDLSFYRELQNRFGAPGDFAQAYVIAHEIGHHVQTLLGTNGRVQQLSRENPDEANELSIRLELQADCYAGIWANTARERGLLERGDLEEGLTAAAAVGDDRIQQSTQGRIDPESWTHGSAEQRVEWFRRGFDAGDPNACDTFSEDL